MKYFFSVLLIAAFISCGSDNPNNGFDYDEDPPVDDSIKAGELIWSDEFNSGSMPNSSDWAYDIGHGSSGWGNNEVQYYTDESKNVRIENGNLVIEALKEDGEWTSARIKTQGKQSYTYVTVKVRAKLPEGSGTWPAIWMLGSDIAEVGWPACGEIDIMEHVGKDPGIVHSALHTPASYGNTQNTGVREVSDFNEEFHVYEAEWTSDRITFKIDGNTFYSYEPSVKNDQTWPYNDNFFIILNIAMGGNWGSDTQYETDGLKNGIDPNLSKARMEIDYVRVYKN